VYTGHGSVPVVDVRASHPKRSSKLLLDKLKFGDIQKLKTANEASKKTNKDSMGKISEAKKITSTTEKDIEVEAKELESTDD
jgi:hypothetical protein